MDRTIKQLKISLRRHRVHKGLLESLPIAFLRDLCVFVVILASGPQLVLVVNLSYETSLICILKIDVAA